MLDFVGLGPLAARYRAQLSGGQMLPITSAVLKGLRTMLGARRSMRLALLFVMIAVSVAFGAGSLSGLMAPGKDGPITNPTDFRAFYCAGAALDAGRDPYRTQPMWGCQRDVLRANGLIIDDRHVLPAPLPPYALALFAALAKLPFPAASVLWASLGILAVVATIVLVHRISGLPLIVTAPSLLFALGWASLVIGQVVPFVVCALCAAAFALQKRRYVPAAAFTLFAMIEPHVALPVLAALAVAIPRTRAPLAVGVAALAMLSLAVVGPAVCFEYATQVLPLHALSEVTNFEAQYSLSSLLWLLGVPAAFAVKLAELAYVALVVAGVTLGRKLAERYDDGAFIVTAPLAFALAGGPFVHIHQIAAAMPLALMLAARVPVRGAARAGLFAAVACLAVPWQTVAELPPVADVLGYGGRPADAATLPPPEPDAIAEVPETRYLVLAGGYRDRRSIEQALIKLPTWFGLAMVLGVATAATWRSGSRARSGAHFPIAPASVSAGSKR